jgi:hypothetical protein
MVQMVDVPLVNGLPIEFGISGPNAYPYRVIVQQSENGWHVEACDDRGGWGVRGAVSFSEAMAAAVTIVSRTPGANLVVEFA